jgi:hypothetical protein
MVPTPMIIHIHIHIHALRVSTATYGNGGTCSNDGMICNADEQVADDNQNSTHQTGFDTSSVLSLRHPMS